jgi:hypothetical protein
MLAKCGKEGIVEASLPGLADAARVSVEECRKALARLMEVDPDSRTKEHGGRRIEEVDGGWLVLNHAKYRNRMSAEDRREYQRVWMREYRYRKKANVREAKASAGRRVLDEAHQNGGMSA